MHTDDPVGVPPENEQQPEPDQQSSTASPNPSPASNEKQPERAQRNFTTSKSALPSSAPPGLAATLKNAARKDARDRWVDEMWREAMERKTANDNSLPNDFRLPLERLRVQLSDAIDTKYWLTLEPITEEQDVKQVFVVLLTWRQGVNELLSGLPLSDAHSHGLKYPEMFWRLYRKASEARGGAVGEHLRQLADGLSSEFAEANKTHAHEAQLAAVETSVAARKAGLHPGPVTSWEQVEIAFISDERVLVIVGSTRKTLNYAEFGCEDGRSHKPNLAWITLKILAKEGGSSKKPLVSNAIGRESRNECKKSEKCFASTLDWIPILYRSSGVWDTEHASRSV